MDIENPEITLPPKPIKLILGEGLGAFINFVIDLRFFMRYEDKTKGDAFEVSQIYPINNMPELVGRDDIVVYKGEEFTVSGIDIMFVDRTKTVADNSPAQVLTIVISAVNK